MAVLSTLSLLDISLVVVGLYLLKRLLAAKPPAPYPPGPSPLPLIGNVHQYPQSHEWKTFYDWSEKYGDLVMVNLLGQRMLIINSSQTAVNLLDKKSTIYSDRPVLQFCTELVGWKRALALVPYGERFRELRRLLHGSLAGKVNLAEYSPVEELETRRFLLRVLQNSGANLQEDIRRLAGTIILKVSHGYEVKGDHDPIVSLVEKTMDEFAAMSMPGAYLVDLIPALQYLPEWFPGTGFKRVAREMAQRLQETVDKPHDFVKEQMAKGIEIPSYTSKHLEAKNTSEDLIKFGAFAIYGGGADTTVSAEYSFYLAMTLNPEIQAIAQAEIDAVIGHDRLPTLADRDQLPYVDALVKEVFRWNPVAPQGVPHRLKEDDIHEGYFIPKDTICIANIWKYAHDPRTYADPHAFQPARFIASSPLNAKGEAEQDPRQFIFGFGRRICPGLQLADSSVFTAVAMALAAFTISPAEKGVLPPMDYTSGLISHPKVFPCVVTPRSARAEALVRAVEDA